MCSPIAISIVVPPGMSWQGGNAGTLSPTGTTAAPVSIDSRAAPLRPRNSRTGSRLTVPSGKMPIELPEESSWCACSIGGSLSVNSGLRWFKTRGLARLLGTVMAPERRYSSPTPGIILKFQSARKCMRLPPRSRTSRAGTISASILVLWFSARMKGSRSGAMLSRPVMPVTLDRASRATPRSRVRSKTPSSSSGAPTTSLASGRSSVADFNVPTSLKGEATPRHCGSKTASRGYERSRFATWRRHWCSMTFIETQNPLGMVLLQGTPCRALRRHRVLLQAPRTSP